jgi:CO dehydrogenase nickel-insertion accessory protein CooC1
MLCSDAAAQEKREFNQRKALSDEAQQCLLVEEIPVERKLTVVLQKLTKIQETYDTYKKTSNEKDSLGKILADAKAYKAELDAKKQEAEDLSNKYNW